MNRFRPGGGVGLALVLLAGTLDAQNSRPPKVAAVTGIVTTEAGELVQGARIELQGSGFSATTGASGSFRIEGVKPGRYWIVAGSSGLEVTRRAITLEADRERVLEFHLGPLPPRLSAAKSEEIDSLYRDFARRLNSSLDGVFLTHDDIERSRQPQLGAVLAKYLVQVTPRTAVRVSTNCAPYESWYSQQATRGSRFAADWQAFPFISINGARPFRGRALYEFNPADIQALEFYRGAGPVFGYLPASAECGLVILWTK